MNFARKGLSVALLAAASSLSMSQALANDYDYGFEQQKTQEINANTSSVVSAAEDAIVQALKLATGQLSGNLNQQTAADTKVADAQDDQETKRRIEDAKYQATREAMPTVSRCISTTSAITAAPLETNAGAVRTAVSQQLVNWDLGAGNVQRAEAARRQVAAHCGKFSTAADVQAGLCSSATASSDLAYADVDASRSLFAAETLPADNAEASNLLITNIVGSDPWRAIPSDQASTVEGRAEIAKRNQIVAKRSVATEALSYLRSNKEAMESTELTNWANARAAATGLQRGDSSESLSVDGHIELQSRSWFFDQDWLKSLQDKPMDAKVADLADMQAFQVYQNFKNYQLLERITSILATSLAITVDQEKARVINVAAN